MTREHRGESLASNMTILTLMTVTISVTIIGLAALMGVYDLARNQVAARHAAVRSAVGVELENRLASATRVLDAAGSTLTDPETDGVDVKGLAVGFETGIEYVDRLVVARDDGTVLASFPQIDVTGSVAALHAYQVGVSNTTTFSLAGTGEDAELWVTRRLERGDDDYLVLTRVRTQFVGLMLREFAAADPGRIVSIVRPDGAVLFSGSTETTLDAATLRFDGSESQQVGSASAFAEDGRVLWGQYSELRSYPGLEWRVAVLEPRSRVVDSTWRALTPAVIAMLVSAAFSFTLAALFARRLVEPLRGLERHAREGVSGAYVPPLRVERSDEVGRLAEAFNAIALRLNALQDLSQLLASSSSLDQVLDGILSAMGHIVGSANVAILLVDDGGDGLQIARGRGLKASVMGTTVPVNSYSWLAQGIESAGPRSVSLSRHELAPMLPGLAGQGHVSSLVAPLQAGVEPLGVILVVRDDEHAFSQAEIEMVRTFSAQAAVAVYNSRLFEIETNSRREAEALRTVAEALADPTDAARSFQTVTWIMKDLFDVDGTSIAFLDRAALQLPVAVDEAAERQLLAAWAVAWDSGDGDIVIRIRPGDDPAIDRYLAVAGAAEALLLTVMQSDRPGAVVAMTMDTQARQFAAHERSLAYALGKQLSLALDNALHYAEARSRAANLETIFRISQAVSSSLQIKVVLNRVLDVVQKIFSADTVSLMQFDDTTRLVSTVMARGMISSEILHFDCKPGEDVPGRVFQTGEPSKHDDLLEIDTPLATIASRQHLRSMLAVPLLARGRSIGVLSVYSAEPSAFTHDDMGLLHTFASQAALAIDTAALYGREHHVASVLQASILPHNLPEFDEVESASVYLAAGEEVEIGGDYFDLFRAGDGRIVLAIGDVCGKGVEAATKTSMIKYMVRGLIAAGLEPDRVLSEVNKAVAETGDTSEIVTLFVGMLDADANKLCYADGGHPPAIIRRADTGKTVRLETTGALLGAIPDALYEQIEVPFGPDDVIVLYTDGVTEARRGNKFFGEGRVRRAVGAGGSASEVADRLLGSLDRFVPGTLRDDAAVLAVRARRIDERSTAGSREEGV